MGLILSSTKNIQIDPTLFTGIVVCMLSATFALLSWAIRQIIRLTEIMARIEERLTDNEEAHKQLMRDLRDIRRGKYGIPPT